MKQKPAKKLGAETEGGQSGNFAGLSEQRTQCHQVGGPGTDDDLVLSWLEPPSPAIPLLYLGFIVWIIADPLLA